MDKGLGQGYHEWEGGGTKNSSNAGTSPTGVGYDPGHGYREGMHTG